MLLGGGEGLAALRYQGTAHARIGSKTGKAQIEQIFSALAPEADMAEPSRYFRVVPQPDSCSAAKKLLDDRAGRLLEPPRHISRHVSRPSSCAVFMLIDSSNLAVLIWARLQGLSDA